MQDMYLEVWFLLGQSVLVNCSLNSSCGWCFMVMKCSLWMAIRDPKGHPCKHWYCVKFSKDEWESVFLQILEIQTIPTKCFKFFFWGGGDKRKKERAIIVSTKALYFSSFGNEFIYSRIVILYRLKSKTMFQMHYHITMQCFCRISKKVFVHHIVTLFLWKCRIICSKVICWKYMKFNIYNDKMMTSNS